MFALRELEIRPHDPDDQVWIPAQVDGVSDDRRIPGEPSAPQVIAEQDDTVSAGPFIVRRERATQNRAHAKNGKEVGREARGDQPLWFSSPDQLKF